ncbi:hypothetical protein FHW37_11746 [Neorhizobium alkalisoli]|uniref:Uncharacterized protein n=1 Tax=Neorhizobium alkalisoli TaxID=528178 RepID=A0A561Q0Q2_9HYPH|nr:hypothetical protein FHW37_11746 [Neorhizobium alkalisoli]
MLMLFRPLRLELFRDARVTHVSRGLPPSPHKSSPTLLPRDVSHALDMKHLKPATI